MQDRARKIKGETHAEKRSKNRSCPGLRLTGAASASWNLKKERSKGSRKFYWKLKKGDRKASVLSMPLLYGASMNRFGFEYEQFVKNRLFAERNENPPEKPAGKKQNA